MRGPPATGAPRAGTNTTTETRNRFRKLNDGQLSDRKTHMAGSYQVSLATTRGIADAILATVQRGKELSWLDEYPAAIDRLTLD